MWPHAKRKTTSPYPMSALPSSKKTHSEKHKQIFRQLLREEPNKQCADCKVLKNPRWASWSLGCFLCIRCLGIHRGMGTHISKVKLVDLDAWTDDQVENMIKWGNAKCNAFWELKLPANYVPDALKIENYIRTKYDLKKWAALTTIPDPLTMKTPTPLAATLAPAPTSALTLSRASAPQKSAAPSQALNSANLLDDLFLLPAPTPPAQPAQPQPHRAASTHKAPVQQTPTPPRPQSTGSSMGSRPDLKKLILSLYSSPLALSSSFVQQSYSPPAQPQSPYQQPQSYLLSTLNSVTSSLNGLSFSSSQQPQQSVTPKQSVAPQAPPQPKPQPKPQPSWNNEWSDVPLGGWSLTPPAAKPAVNLNGLDDDLFKNVWS